MAARIEVNPNVHFGKPCVAGTRIPVVSVLELIRAGIGFQQILDEYYPDLTLDDLQACVQYAMDVLGAEDLHISVSR